MTREEDTLPSVPEQIRLLIRHAPELVTLLDADGRILLDSPASERILGWREGELVGRPFVELIHPDDRAAAVEIHRRALARPGYTRTIEMRLRGRNDEYRVFEIAGLNLLDDESVGGILLFTRDVTDGRRADQASARRDEILEALAFAAGQLLRTVDWSEGVQAVVDRLGEATRADRAYVFENRAGDDDDEILATLRFEWCTEGVEPRIGNPELVDVPWKTAGFGEWYDVLVGGGAVLGRPEDFSPPTRDFLAAQDIRNVAVVPIAVGDELWGFAGFDDCRGEREWSKAEIEALQAAANLIAAAVEAGRVRAELERREERLRTAVKMEAVGRLTGGIAHDFNNLLTAIQGYADLAAGEIGPEGPGRASVEEIAKAARRAAELTQQLLAYSRQQTLRPVALDLNRIVHEMEGMLGRLMGEDIVIETRLDPAGCTVRIDPGKFEQILMNIAVNARDAMPDGGRLAIETANVDLVDPYVHRDFTIEPGRYATLVVSDDGIGMDERVRRHVFDPFFTTKEVGKGTGLGLSTVYGIVKQSGGWIWLYSEPGRGTTFKIYLPRHGEAPLAPPEEDPVEAAAGGSEVVLVAEDEGAVRRLAARALADRGYEVLEASSAREAIEVHRRRGAVDLLVTDVIMPEMNGRELADRLRAGNPDLGVLYMSGYASDRFFDGESEIAFLPKPFTGADLARKVREMLDASPG